MGGAATFPVTVTTHFLNTTDGKTFTISSTTTKAYDKAAWEKAGTCENPNGDTFTNVPQWRCDLFYGYAGMAGLTPGTLVVDEAKHAVVTTGYDPAKATKGMALRFAEKSGGWTFSAAEMTYYVP